MEKRYLEYYAREILEFINPKIYNNINIIDKPDLQMEHYGIEVSSIVDEKYKQSHKEFSKLLNYNNILQHKLNGVTNEEEKKSIINKEKEYAINRFKIIEENGCSIFANSMLSHPHKDNFNQLFKEIFEHKLDKLNEYDKKDIYEIFLFNECNDIQDYHIKFIENYLLSLKTKERSYSRVYVMECFNLYIFDINDKNVNVDKIYISGYQIYDLSQKAFLKFRSNTND